MTSQEGTYKVHYVDKEKECDPMIQLSQQFLLNLPSPFWSAKDSIRVLVSIPRCSIPLIYLSVA